MGAALALMGASSLCECAACCACSILNLALSTMRRVAHLLILILVFSLAIILGRGYPEKFGVLASVSTVTSSSMQINLTGGCSVSFLDECLYRQLVFRAGLALFLLFSFLAVGSYFLEVLDRSMWPLKICAVVGLFVAFFFSPNADFARWAELARVFSFFWMMIQNLLVLELAHGCHDVIMKRAAEEEAKTRGDSRFYLALYLGLCALLLALSLVGLAYLFDQYAGCSIGTFFVASTLTMGLVTTGLSMSPLINKGIMTPVVCFSYAILLTWYALLSSPDASCNPTSNENNGEIKNFSVYFFAFFSSTVLMVCICTGEAVLGIFNAQATEGLLDGSSRGELEVDLVPPNAASIKATELPFTAAPEPATSGSERAFFHACLALFSCLVCMILTSWGSSDGTPESSSTSTSTESMWLKAVALLSFQVMYLKSLHAAALDQN